MNYRRIARLLGRLVLGLAACMASSIPWSMVYDTTQNVYAFLGSSLITAVAGAFMIAWRFLPSHAHQAEFDVIDLPDEPSIDPTLDAQPAPVVGD